MNRLIAECVGTFCLVLAGTGAIIVNHVSGGQVTHVGVALTFGLVVMAMIDALGDTSGAHMNPAVTLAFVLARRFPARDAPAYIAAQTTGALLASTVLRALFPDVPTLGQTTPAGPAWQSFALETLLTFILMLVILAVATGSKEKGVRASVAIGGVVALEALFAGPITGASMNPARSLAPALLAADLASLWIYLLAPTLGAALAVPAHHAIRTDPRDLQPPRPRGGDETRGDVAS